jgi:hypothetical protein
MDLEKFYNEKYISHWAEELELGDRCLATIRHKTDGSKNRNNIEIVVGGNDTDGKRISGWCNGEKFIIPYNELSQLP